MATGDQIDIAQRIKSTFPRSWFPLPAEAGATTTTPVLDGLLAGLGSMWAAIYQLIAYTVLQTRLQTSTGAFLDMTSADYLGSTLPRLSGELDAAFRVRIVAAIQAAKNTRAAVLLAIVTAAPGSVLIEPWRSTDTKGLGSRSAPAAGGGYGYGTKGLRYGSMARPATLLIEAPAGSSSASIGSAVLAVKAAGVIAWVRVLPS